MNSMTYTVIVWVLVLLEEDCCNCGVIASSDLIFYDFLIWLLRIFSLVPWRWS